MSQQITTIEEARQAFEIALSGDFENMSLEELQKTQAEITRIYEDLEKVNISGGDLYTHDGLSKARDFMWFCTTKRENENDSVQIGDIFHTSWGYDQTNVEFYKVVGFTKSKKSAIVREIGSKIKEGSEGFMCDSAYPDPDNELKEDGKPKPDLRLKIERSHQVHPYTNKVEEIGEIQLRGSVYYGGLNKHLQTLYRVKEGDSKYRSWYA